MPIAIPSVIPSRSGPRAVINRLAVGVNQPPGSGRLFPFVSPGSAIDHLLGDFFVSFDDLADEIVYPLRVAWMYGFGTQTVSPPAGWPTPTHDYDLVVLDANDTVVFDSTTAALRVTNWCDRLLILEWTNAHNVCRCTKYMTWDATDVADSQTRTYQNYILPGSGGELQQEAWYKIPKRVLSLQVRNNLNVSPIDIRKTAVILNEGYNISLELLSPEDNLLFDLPNFTSESPLVVGTRLTHQIELRAVPGLGQGAFPGCEGTEKYLRTINQVRSNVYQNFTYDSEGCIRTQRPIGLTDTEPREFDYVSLGLQNDINLERFGQYAYADPHTEATSAIELNNDCQNCCDCDYFAQTYQGLKRQWFLFRSVAHAAEDVRDTYARNRDRWLIQKSIREQDSLRLRLVLDGNNKLSWGVAFCNASKCCISNVEMFVGWTQYLNGVLQVPVTSQYPCGSAIIEGAGQCNGPESIVPDVLGTEGQLLRFTWDYSEPQSITTISGRQCIPDTSAVPEGSLKTQMWVGIRWGTTSPDPATGLVCPHTELSAIALPDEMLTLWTNGSVPYLNPLFAYKSTPLSVVSGANPFCKRCDCAT